MSCGVPRDDRQLAIGGQVNVYQLTCLANDKLYIGQHSGDDLEAYLRHTLADAFNPHNRKVCRPLYRAMRKYGREAFVIQSLVRPINKSQMDELEKFFIRTFDTQNREVGYNVTSGGEGVIGYVQSPTKRKAQSKFMMGRTHSAKLDEAQVLEVYDLLRQGFTQVEIATRFNVVVSCITAINIGKSWEHLFVLQPHKMSRAGKPCISGSTYAISEVTRQKMRESCATRVYTKRKTHCKRGHLRSPENVDTKGSCKRCKHGNQRNSECQAAA
jgi:group I intron endonuclease